MNLHVLLSLSVAGFLGASATRAFAIPMQFEGVFSYTFTELQQRDDEISDFHATSQIGDVSVGEIFYGIYTYMSESIDGAFGAAGADSLAAHSFSALSLTYHDPFPMMDFVAGHNGFLVVDGGCVVDAGARYQAGGNVLDATFGGFQYRENGWNHIGSGFMSWGDPRRVPDAASTLSLLGLSLVGLVACRRRWARRP